MKRLLLSLMICIGTLCAYAQKQHYIPYEWRNRTDTLIYAKEDPNNKYTWSESRSKESDNIIVYWDKYYGNTIPTNAPSTYRVDIDDLLKKCEEFFDLEINQLGFVDPKNSNLNKYKVMVLINHSADWICVGSGYDYQVSAIWLSPWACHPVGQSVAHEIGHSFHYMCYSEASKQGTLPNVQTGFHGAVGNGSVTWEQTAQWQSVQSYPELMFDQSISVFRNSHNLAFTHEWHRYQSYWLFYYLVQHYGVKAVSDVWNYPVNQVLDFNEVLMLQQNWNVEELFRRYYDYAAHCVTWDWDACKPYRNPFIGDFRYAAVLNGEGQYQVAYSSCPQSTGFNAVPLNVPAAGTEVTTTFTALASGAELAEGDPAEYLNGNSYFQASGRTKYNTVGLAASRGFRLGYVALLNDGTRVYESVDTIYCTGRGKTSCDVKFTVPENVNKLWLMVVPAPTRYFQHKWDDSPGNDDQWPYTLEFSNTDLDATKAIVYVSPVLDGREIDDITFTYDLYFPHNATAYNGTSITIGGKAAAMLGTAFQMSMSDIAAKLTTYSSAGPGKDKVMFYPAKADGTLISNKSTANGYGHWFSNNGSVVEWSGNSYVFSEFLPGVMTFSIGQYPGKCPNGSNYTIAQALVYNNGSKKAKAVFVFNIHIDASKTGAELVSVDYAGDNTNAIHNISTDNSNLPVNVYTLSGQQVRSAVSRDKATQGLSKGIYIVGKQKVVVK